MAAPTLDLSRFVDAQDANGTYARSLSELRCGAKRSHRMGYVFPQIRPPTGQLHRAASGLPARGVLHPAG